MANKNQPHFGSRASEISGQSSVADYLPEARKSMKITARALTMCREHPHVLSHSQKSGEAGIATANTLPSLYA